MRDDGRETIKENVERVGIENCARLSLTGWSLKSDVDDNEVLRGEVESGSLRGHVPESKRGRKVRDISHRARPSGTIQCSTVANRGRIRAIFNEDGWPCVEVIIRP